MTGRGGRFSRRGAARDATPRPAARCPATPRWPGRAYRRTRRTRSPGTSGRGWNGSRCCREGGACVEAATCPHTLHVRESQVTDGPTFAVAPAAWTAFRGHAANI
ncbi:DUF397 domain-containing protein [Streptomyces sp. NBC_01013]|uniref:DUF397 domain-containing protein n=1 Tax=Streptomyces sp. NBC_01013 TaxID=2903718 RepID=UPI00386755CF